MKKILCYFDPAAKKILTEKLIEDGEKKVMLSSPYNFVYLSEIVARVIDIDNDEQIPTRLDPGYDYYRVLDFMVLKADSGIYYDETMNAYKAAEYGFVILDEQRLRLISALSVSRDKLKAFYSIYPTKLGKVPTYADIEETLHKNAIMARVEQGKVEEQLKGIDPGNPRFVRILVAQGREPVNGHEEYYLPLINLSKKAGELKSDGSIDFKEIGSIIEVKKGQDVLKRVQKVKPADGYDIYGDKNFADIMPAQGFYKGVNIEPGMGMTIFSYHR